MEPNENKMNGNREQMTDSNEESRRSTRGFASMSPEQQRAIASKGGKVAHQKGVAHQFNSEEARAAGRKGGMTVSRDTQHMARIGQKGGQSRKSLRDNTNNL